MMKKYCVVLLTYSGQSEVSSDWSIIFSNIFLASDWSIIFSNAFLASDWSVMTSFDLSYIFLASDWSFY